MQNLYNRIRNVKLPGKDKINWVFLSFSRKERYIFIGLVTLLLVSTIMILNAINQHFMVNVPMRGGSISEGILGTPRFVNPILANSPTDQDLVSLIYSGLMRKNQNGDLIPDLAEKYEVSTNGLSYTFTLKDNIYFQDNKPITTEDILFTINKAKDSIIKSPQKINWDGVTVEKIDNKTVTFTLKQPYSAFLENTTLGIMPQHLWDGSPMELNNANTNPVGSGPYQIKNTNKQSSGIIDYYELVPFKKFILGEAYIANVYLHFYSNEDELVKALQNKTVDQVSSITPLSAENLKERNYKIESSVLPRIFGLFFNQNSNQIFTDKVITKTIHQLIDRNRIVRDVLFGYGTVIDSPIPINLNPNQNQILTSPREEILQKAQNDLAKIGWKKGEDGFLEKVTTVNKKKVTQKLEFSISTSNAPELAKTAEFIKQDLEAVGIKVEVKTFEIGNLNQNVIRPRKYDALLFGEIINHDSDLFAFWHSSQRKDPGLNVAIYTNAKVDKLLEEAATIVDKDARLKKYLQFESEVKKDMPAVFLYSPNFIYVVSSRLQSNSMKNISSPADRYANIYEWYTQTENVWKIFAK